MPGQQVIGYRHDNDGEEGRRQDAEQDHGADDGAGFRARKTAKKVRDHCIVDAAYANAIRWQPAFKQLIYRNDEDKLIVTISQNSIGNAITELLGVVVRRVPDAEAYARFEPRLIEQLLEVRRRLIEADLGEAIETAYWPG